MICVLFPILWTVEPEGTEIEYVEGIVLPDGVGIIAASASIAKEDSVPSSE